MRRLITFGFCILLVASVAAAKQDNVQGHDAITHGEFAQLVMEIALGYAESTPDPTTALEKLQRWDLVPVTWNEHQKLTHGELSEVLAQVGIEYLPARPQAHVSRTFVTTLLWRQTGKLRDYVAARLVHGFSANHVLDAGVDRAVSPSDYD